jgi:hypothetical protein
MLSSQIVVNPSLTPVRVATTSNQTATYYNGPTNSGVGATLTFASGVLTINGVTLVLNDRVLLAGQTLGNQNGVYVVKTAGAVGVAGVLQRAADLQSIDQVYLGQVLSVAAGTVGSGALFVVVEPKPAQFGVDNLVFSSAGSFDRGTMASQNANAVAITGGTITGITPLPIASGGSNSATGAAALTSFGVKRGTTTTYAGGGTSTSFTANTLAATDLVFAEILTSANNAVAITKAVPTVNTLSVFFTADPGAGTTVQWVAFPSSLT